jgi:hypothetical protein
MNKEDLEKLSDFEVNKLVAKSLGIEWHCRPGSKQNSTGGWLFSDNCKGGCDSLADYCNSPSDMWPLIYESLIETAPLANSDKWKAAGATYSKRGERSVFTVHHENPLRAAAIVYLLVQE